MEDSDLLRDVRYLREVVEKTRPSGVNRYWPVTLGWGCVVTAGYAGCALLAMSGHAAALPWVWPVLIFAVGFPLHWYLVRRARRQTEAGGVRPRFRRDLMWCWISITAMGLLWTAGMVVSGAIATQWHVLSFVWCSLYIVGYVMNGVLLSKEWFWAAGALLAAVVAAFAAGPDYYWLPGAAIGATFLMAGLLGRRTARRQIAEA